jgi:hypothetical protein
MNRHAPRERGIQQSVLPHSIETVTDHWIAAFADDDSRSDY